MVLVVACDGRDWLADVGFGGEGLIEPMPIGPSRRSNRRAGDTGWCLTAGSTCCSEKARPAGTISMSLPSRQFIRLTTRWGTGLPAPIPRVRSFAASRLSVPSAQSATFSAISPTRSPRPGGSTVREISRAELVPLLRDTFGLDIPADATFQALDGLRGIMSVFFPVSVRPLCFLGPSSLGGITLAPPLSGTPNAERRRRRTPNAEHRRTENDAVYFPSSLAPNRRMTDNSKTFSEVASMRRMVIGISVVGLVAFC